MAKESLIVKQQRLLSGKKKTFPVRRYYRCQHCGRPRAYMRKFGLCRICFREFAHAGYIPGIVKSSW